MTAEKTEIDAIDPVSDVYVMDDGFEIRVLPLRTRQLLKLLRILTRGAAPLFEDFSGALLEGDPDEISGRLIGLMVFAIPEAEDETMEFLRSMVEPVSLASGLSKQSREKNNAAQAEVDERMDNPGLTDVFGLVRMIISRESGELAALGKQIAAMLEGSQEAATPTQDDDSKKESKKTSK